MTKKPNIRLLSRPFDYQSDGFAAVWKEMEDAAPRAAAIMAGAFVEDALRWSIGGFFADGLTNKELCKVFEGDGAPLGSFHGKILIGYALGLYGPTARRDLVAIKQIRNAFAHAPRAITFETPQIVSACKNLGYLQAAKGRHEGRIAPMRSPTPTNPKELFFATAKILHIDLHIIRSEYADQLGNMP
jgi:hypothetical protein